METITTDDKLIEVCKKVDNEVDNCSEPKEEDTWLIPKGYVIGSAYERVVKTCSCEVDNRF